jgi:hypothetical protein
MKEHPTPASLQADFIEIIRTVVSWPRVDWREHKITINEMATISARIERLLEERCSDASETAERLEL